MLRKRHFTRTLLEQAAGRTYERWDGKWVRPKKRTIEDWYYAWRKDGLRALRPTGRLDAGKSRAIRPELAELICATKRENPRRSVRRIIKLLVRAGKAREGELKRSTVHRLLLAHGISTRPARHADQERRAFRHPFVGDVWMGDVLHGPVVRAPDGRMRKAYLHALIDSASRYVPAATFRLGETAADHEAVLKEAFLKHGLPRVYYVDRGAAQTSRSLTVICAELGLRLVHCRPYDPQAKAAVERFLRTVREEVLDELGEQVLELGELNARLWSWLAVEYHRRCHGGTGREPLAHWLSEAEKVRAAPRAAELEHIFQHRAQRKVRKDSTIRFLGRRLEVRPELCGQTVELRFAPGQSSELPTVYIDGHRYCDTVELDLVRNSRRRRRRLHQTNETPSSPKTTGLDPLGLICAEHDRRIRPPTTRHPDRSKSKE